MKLENYFSNVNVHIQYMIISLLYLHLSVIYWYNIMYNFFGSFDNLESLIFVLINGK